MKRKTPHAVKRAATRFGVELLPSDVAAIVHQCYNGAPTLVKDCGNGCRKHAVWINGTVARAVFNPSCGKLVTVMYANAEEVRHLSAYVEIIATRGIDAIPSVRPR